MTDRDVVLAAGRAHLARIEAAADSSITLDSGVAADLQLLYEYTLTDDGAADLDALYVHGMLRWHRHLADPDSGDGALGRLAATLDLSHCFAVGMTPLPETLLPDLATMARWGEDTLRDRAEKLSERARAAGDRQRIAAAISLWQRMIAPQHPVHPEDVPMSWSNLGVLLSARYELDGSTADLSEAIDAFRRALELEAPGNSERINYQSNLSAALYQRALITGSAEDREEALALGRACAELREPGSADRGKPLSNLGISLLRGYEQSGTESDLSAAIAAFEEARSGCGTEGRDLAGISSNLGNALLRRSEVTGSAADLQASVAAHRDAVRATAPEDPNRAKRLTNLSTALCASFTRLTRDADLDEAIEAATQALELLGPGRPDRLAALFSLGGALEARFVRSGSLDDLDEGIRLLREAADEASSSHADHAMFIGNLGAFLMMRYEWTGAVADLDAAIEMGRAAVDAAAAGYVHRPALLSFLGSALSDRARLPEPPGLSRKELLDQAVAAGQEALATAPPGHHLRARYLNALASSLHARAELTGSEADLNQAVDEAEAAAQVGHPAPADSHQAERAERLSNLATILRSRASRTGSSADLDRALAVGYLAMNAIPPGHHTQAMLLMNTASCMQDHFKLRGERKSLILAREMYLLAAGTRTATPTVRIHALREAASLTAKPLDLRSLSPRARTRNAAALLENAVLLLPEVAPRQLARTDQQRHISEFAGLASDAAAYALADERRGQNRARRAARAISLLEYGRGIMLSQALDTRSDLTELRQLRPDLAQRYERLRDLLDRPPDEGKSSLIPGEGTRMVSLPGQDRAQLARDFAATVAEIRSVDGLAGFMSPPPLSDLADAAGSGAVIFNVGSLRSDAILLKSSGEIDYVHLPLLTLDALAEKIELFHTAQELRMGRLAGGDAALDAERMLLEILEWLWDVAARPALDALGFDGTPNPWGLYEVKWVPGGLLGQLPIHAAGRHLAAAGSTAAGSTAAGSTAAGSTAAGSSPAGSSPAGPAGRQAPTVMDRAISSYAPTIRALHTAHSQSMAKWRERPGRSLIVAMPVAAGAANAANAANAAGAAGAVRRLHAALPGSTVLMPSPYPDGIDAAMISGEPSPAEVLDRLNDCEIAHFICHGVTDPVDPSRSRLMLGARHRSDPLTVTGLAPVRLGSARLAYLSACSTARNEVSDLADESIHLASAFQLAGFPHVIGALWEIDSGVAAVIASEFYQRISASRGFPDVNRAAAALHEITCDLRRDEPESPFTWAGYVHVGT